MARAILSIASSVSWTGWNSESAPFEERNARAAASVFHVTTGSGVTPGSWRQIGNPSDLQTIAYMGEGGMEVI
jgi:hypothetical protein